MSKLIDLCIKCGSKEATRGEFCSECFEELRKGLPPEEEPFEIPGWEEIEEKW